MTFLNNIEFARRSDEADELKEFRNMFYNEDDTIIYMDGNSLGRLPLNTIDKMKSVLEYQWGSRLIRSWNEEWINLSERVASKIAKIVGAGDDEILVGDSTSVNLFKLVLAALQLNRNRKLILSDEFNFPSDLYILDGIKSVLNDSYEIRLIGSNDGIYPDISVIENMNENTALVTLSHVHFKSGFKYDMGKITELAHRKGAFVLWDLSHSVGAVPVALNECDADFAVGCTYKYLNGGPGANAFLYVRRELIDKVQNYLQGWFGSANAFEFNLEYKAQSGIEKFFTGTPNILSLSAIEPALDIHLNAGMHRLYRKSVQLSEYMLLLIKENLNGLGFEVITPADYQRRGSHISLKHPNGFRITQALINSNKLERNIIPDFRKPDIIRFGITPINTSFEDIFNTIKSVEFIVKSNEHKNFPDHFNGRVT